MSRLIVDGSRHGNDHSRLQSTVDGGPGDDNEGSATELLRSSGFFLKDRNPIDVTLLNLHRFRMLRGLYRASSRIEAPRLLRPMESAPTRVPVERRAGLPTA